MAGHSCQEKPKHLSGAAEKKEGGVMTKEELRELVGLASLELKINKNDTDKYGDTPERETIRAIVYGFVLLSVGLYKKSKNPLFKQHITI
jgi:hypothetical protein